MDKNAASATGAGTGAVVGFLVGGPVGLGMGTAVGGTVGRFLGSSPLAEDSQEATVENIGNDGLPGEER
jgi:uncharacterized protein YcfJ